MIDYRGIVPNNIVAERDAWSYWLQACIEERGFKASQISFFFCSTVEIVEQNRLLLNHDYPTDIITIDQSVTRRLKVLIYIGIEVVEDNSREYGVSVLDECARVMVHGLLHCMGWNDVTQEEKRLMREEEDKCLISRPK